MCVAASNWGPQECQSTTQDKNWIYWSLGINKLKNFKYLGSLAMEQNAMPEEFVLEGMWMCTQVYLTLQNLRLRNIKNVNLSFKNQFVKQLRALSPMSLKCGQ